MAPFAYHRTLVPGLIALAVLTGATACVSPQQETIGISGSRATLYGSLQELVADSAVVVTAAVIETTEFESSGIPATRATLQVMESVPVTGLGANKGTVAVSSGDTIKVTQYGTEVVSSSAPLLVVGKSYLLFLVSTGLPDAPADEFFVTGVSAGIYEQSADGYVSLATDDDVVPARLTVEELLD